MMDTAGLLMIGAILLFGAAYLVYAFGGALADARLALRMRRRRYDRRG